MDDQRNGGTLSCIYILPYQVSKNQSLIVQQESQGQRNLLENVHSYIFLT